MKNYFLIFTLLLSTLLFSQNQEIKTELPTIIPPAPTAAGLMKFEEIPVSNYTGIPDVSIPLFNSSTHSKDINLYIALRYHPAGIAADEKASDLGLGWSLFAGGTISRTVRGLPDEELMLLEPKKVGLYHNTGSIDVNRYYYLTQNFGNIPSAQVENMNEFLWETTEKGKFDSEHDLWQFNFMGFSGRFYIIKNTNNQLEVKPLDDYRIKIINNYITVGNNPFIPSGFTIYDENGNKYIFDVIETTNAKTVISRTWPNTSIVDQSISAGKDYNSAFQLSKVYDTNNNLVVEFIFNPDTTLKEFSGSNTTINNTQYTGICYNDPNCSFQFDSPDGASTVACTDGIEGNYRKIEPSETFSNVITVTKVKKLQGINIIGKAKIDFVFGTTPTTPALVVVLKELTIKNWNSSFIKKFKFDYLNTTVRSQRTTLEKILEYNSTNTFINNYQFFYKQEDFNNYTIGKDFWGYYNGTFICDTNQTLEKEVSTLFSTSEILQKIKYPTGGCSVFDYESNTYSYIGDQLQTNFDERYDDYIFNSTEGLGFTGTSNATNTQAISISNQDRLTKFYPSYYYPLSPDLPDRNFMIVEMVNGEWRGSSTAEATGNAGLICPYDNQSCCVTFKLKKNIQYGIRRLVLNTDPPGDAMILEHYTKKPSNRNYSYGGGNRIKTVGYFDVDVDQNYYVNSSAVVAPIKEKKFTYNLPNDITRSSGSLVFAKPVFSYFENTAPCINCGTELQGPTGISFLSTTTFNNLQSVRTQGSDVGYKYVSIYETGNGKSDFTYSSPIDYPEDNYNFYAPPFLPTKNIDYKRGLLLKEDIFDSASKTLRQINYNYDFIDYVESTGLKIFYPKVSCAIGNKFATYAAYKTFLDYMALGNSSYQNITSNCNCGTPLSYISYQKVNEAYGWSKLATKNTKNYSYSGGVTNVLEINETYTYNSLNKQIASQTTTASNSGSIKTDYFYHTGNSVYSQNRIAAIEKIDVYKNSNLLSSNKINYGNNWTNNVAYLPQSIATLTTNQTLENRLIYNAYDEFGNPLEVQQESGMLISYIWGYNQTQPIAKIENASYASVQSQVANLQALSNTATEDNLIQALNSLRTSLPNAMVTTYTYKPLIGVSTVTDPKGDKITYFYDSFNRLKEVKDKNNNLLSENQYNYKQ